MILSDAIYLEVMWNCKMLLPVQTTSRLIPCTPAPDPEQPTWSPKVVLHPRSKIFRGEAAKKNGSRARKKACAVQLVALGCRHHHVQGRW